MNRAPVTRQPKLEPYGPDAWLLQLADTLGAGAFFIRQHFWQAARAAPPVGLAECVPGATTLLFEFLPGRGNVAALRAWLQRHRPTALPSATGKTIKRAAGRLHHIPVRYTGPDLDRVAAHAGLSVTEIIARHSAPEYRVDLIGFAPGFPYLDGLDPQLATPRLDQPRLCVEAGSVAIGGAHTGIYSLAGPGGWNILGFTDIKLFDPETAQCLLTPGDRLVFLPSSA